MSTLLFVHGTGVRDAAYDQSLTLVKSQAAEHLRGIDVQGCAWGEQQGVKPPKRLASVPGHEGSGPDKASSLRDDARAREVRWSLLYDDPLYELRTYAALAAAASAGDALGGSDRSARRAARTAPLEGLRHMLPSAGGVARAGHLAVELVPAALALLQAGDVLANALNASVLAAAERRLPVLARAFVAAWVQVAELRDLPALDGEQRDSLYRDAVAALGGSPKGIKDELLGALGGLASRVATPLLRSHRGAFSDAHLAATNDILLYQTEHGGKAIRGFIAQRILACSAPVFVLAHSLGGIAMVELLVQRADLGVAGLITCGSQAPFLYECDALAVLRRGSALPAHFPKWLNLFDLNDMLSYKAEDVFM